MSNSQMWRASGAVLVTAGLGFLSPKQALGAVLLIAGLLMLGLSVLAQWREEDERRHERLRKVARPFWNLARKLYAQHAPDASISLNRLVRSAKWPPDNTDLTGFTTALYEPEGLLSVSGLEDEFDDARADVKDVFHWWGTRKMARAKAVKCFVSRDVSLRHCETLKLLWYVELAHTGSTDGIGDYRSEPLRAVRGMFCEKR